MVNTSTTYNPYSDTRRVQLEFNFGVIAPDAARLAEPSSSAPSIVSEIAQTIDGVETMSGKYTSLEMNMWILDGSMELYPGDQVGWQGNEISGDTKEYTSAPWLEFEFSQPQDSYGFTLLFDDTQPDNYPAEVTTSIYDSDGVQLGTATTQPDGFTHIVNLAVQNYSRVRFTFGKSNIPHRRIRVCGVRFGINYRYDPDSISTASVRQSISPWAETLASAEIDVSVDNHDQLYNMVNPDGLYAFLQDGQHMEWSITIDGEEIDMGRMYFTTAESEDGGLTASITFNDRILAMDNVQYTGSETGTWTLEEAVSAILTASGTGITATFDSTLGSTVIGRAIASGTSAREALRLCAQAAMCTCYMDRANNLHFSAPSVAETADDTWTRDVQHEDAQIKVGQLYNVVELTVNDTVYTAKNVGEGDFERIYEVTNPLANDGNAVAQWILGWVQRRVSYEVTTRGNPALDLLDTVQINDVYGVNGNAVLTQLNYSYDGGLECDAAAIR